NDQVLTAAVVNQPPVLGPLSGSAQLIPGQAAALTAAFTDPDTQETHTGSFSWGDNTTSTGTLTEANGSGTVAGGHAYAATGTYTVSLPVIDSAGLPSNTVTFPVTVTRSIFLLNLTAGGELTATGNASISVPGMIILDSNAASALVASGNASITAS